MKMKTWTKVTAAAFAALMVAGVAAGCGSASEGKDEAASKAESAVESAVDSAASTATADTADWDDIAKDGKMVIGITYFEPMNYEDENGELTGFETEFTKAVCEKLGVEPVFQKIDWDTKEVELNGKTIDCIWNGMTITDERKENMDISDPYMENKQVMVVKAENAEKFASSENWKDATVVAEKKSAGEDVAKETFKDSNYVPVDSQAKTLLEVKSGTADIAIIDYVMSIGSLGEGSDYSDLVVVEGQEFAPEQYGIAFRKNSPTTVEKVNKAMQELANEGKLEEIAKKYHLEDLLMIKAADSIADKAEDVVEDAKDAASEAVDKLEDAASEAVDKLEDAAEDTKEAVSQAAEDLENKADELVSAVE